MSDKPTQPPSIGRVVHYVDPETGDHLPAIIVAVIGENTEQPLVNLSISRNHPEGPPVFWKGFLEQDGVNKVIDTWHWPEYVPAK